MLLRRRVSYSENDWWSVVIVVTFKLTLHSDTGDTSFLPSCHTILLHSDRGCIFLERDFHDSSTIVLACLKIAVILSCANYHTSL